MTQRVHIHVRQTNRIYSGHIYLSESQCRDLYDALGAKDRTRWQRFKCWLGFDGFIGTVDARMWLVRKDEDDA